MHKESRKRKHILVRYLVLLAISFMVLSIKSEASSNSTNEPIVTETGVKYVYYDDISLFRKDKSHPESDGYVFGGWWTDITENDKDANAKVFSDDAISKSAWAKFVPKDVLSVKAQVSNNITSLSENETVKLRFVTTVDSIDYEKVGFYISYDMDGDGVRSRYKVTSNKVYSSLLYIDATNGEVMDYHPDKEFCSTSKYFKAVTVAGIPQTHFNMKFEVIPFWITLDGTTVKGVSRERLCVSDEVMGPQISGATIDSGTPQIDYESGTIVRTDSSVRTTVYFKGSSKTWEMTGTMRQEDLTNLVLQGFAVKGRKTEEYYKDAFPTYIYGHTQGFVVDNDWTFPYHHPSNNVAGKAGAAKYFVFNPDSAKYFTDVNLTDTSTSNDKLRTATKIDFRLVLANDTIYLWIDNVLSWRIPLTSETFRAYEAGSVYQLGITIAGDNDPGTVIFENLKVRYGDDADTSGIPKFIVKENNVDSVDNVTGVIERSSSSKAQTITFVSEEAYPSNKWEVTGKMYRNSINENVRMGFVVGNGTKTVKFYGYKQGFAVCSSDNEWTYNYDSPNKMNADSYVLNSVAEGFFTSPMKNDDIDFKARIIKDVLYVYFEGELSWKIPLTSLSFGGFDEGSTYDFGVAFDGVDTGTAGFKIESAKSGSQILTEDDFYIRDAYVLADNGTYYLYGSRLGGSFDVLTSDDMMVWEKQEPCYLPADDFWGIESDYWAPEVHKYTNPDNGETAYYLFGTFRGNETTSTRRRGTAILKADSPLGPFKEWSVDCLNEKIYGPVTPDTYYYLGNFYGKPCYCFDGTLYVEDGVPYMVFGSTVERAAWDSGKGSYGVMWYVQLSNDLSRAVGKPVKMFDAQTMINAPDNLDQYITDGPFIYKASDGNLLLLWSSFIQGEIDAGTNQASQYLQYQLKSSNGKLVGASWTYDDNYSILYGNTAEKFDGGHGMVFADFDGEQHLILHTPNLYGPPPAWSERCTILDVVYDTDSKWLKVTADTPVAELHNAVLDDEKGNITTTPSRTMSTRFEGESATWEVSGKLTRTDDVSSEAWCPGFNIKVGTKELTLTAVNSGILFNQLVGTVNASHAASETVYNKNTDIRKFVLNPDTTAGTKREENEMNFKAMIANDKLYVWFGFEGEEMKLSWVVPLTEALYSADGNTQFFEGFDSGSKYNLGMHVLATTGQGQINDLVIKTGSDVDTSVISEITKIQIESAEYAETNSVNGVIESIPSRGPLVVQLKGQNDKWEITGTTTRTDAVASAPWSPGVVIKSGDKELRLDASYVYGKTDYNANDDIAKFIGSPRQKSNMNFKVVVAYDVLYAWFGFEGEEMKLTWKIPLSEALYETGKTTPFFDGFARESKYSVGFYVPVTAGLGNFNHLTVKTGADVDFFENTLFAEKVMVNGKTVQSAATKWDWSKISEAIVEGSSPTCRGQVAYLSKTGKTVLASATIEYTTDFTKLTDAEKAAYADQLQAGFWLDDGTHSASIRANGSGYIAQGNSNGFWKGESGKTGYVALHKLYEPRVELTVAIKDNIVYIYTNDKLIASYALKDLGLTENADVAMGIYIYHDGADKKADVRYSNIIHTTEENVVDEYIENCSLFTTTGSVTVNGKSLASQNAKWDFSKISEAIVEGSSPTCRGQVAYLSKTGKTVLSSATIEYTTDFTKLTDAEKAAYADQLQGGFWLDDGTHSASIRVNGSGYIVQGNSNGFWKGESGKTGYVALHKLYEPRVELTIAIKDNVVYIYTNDKLIASYTLKELGLTENADVAMGIYIYHDGADKKADVRYSDIIHTTDATTIEEYIATHTTK